MFTIDVTVDVRSAIAALDAMHQRHIPFATARALTLTAQKVADAEVREMVDVFDRPRPLTLNAVMVIPATKQTQTATVKLKDDIGKGTPPATYLLTQIKGGERPLKRFESALRSAGVLPAGDFCVPGEAAEMDNYGNMNQGQIVRILSYFKAFGTAGYRANITDKRRKALAKGTRRSVGYEYFVGRPADGRLPLGIWQRFHFGMGSAIKPVVIFVSGTLYEAVYDFRYVAELTVAREFPLQFAAALGDAIRTAR